MKFKARTRKCDAFKDAHLHMQHAWFNQEMLLPTGTMVKITLRRNCEKGSDLIIRQCQGESMYKEAQQGLQEQEANDDYKFLRLKERDSLQKQTWIKVKTWTEIAYLTMSTRLFIYILGYIIKCLYARLHSQIITYPDLA